MLKEYTCIICPNGCEIEVEAHGREIRTLSGALCKRGTEYVKQELTDPRRTISTSVRIEGGELPLVSVRLTKPVPKARIFDVMEEIKKVCVTAPVQEGDVVISNILELDSDVIITKNIKKQ